MSLCSDKTTSLQKDVTNLGQGRRETPRACLLYFLNLDPYDYITQFQITFFKLTKRQFFRRS